MTDITTPLISTVLANIDLDDFRTDTVLYSIPVEDNRRIQRALAGAKEYYFQREKRTRQISLQEVALVTVSRLPDDDSGEADAVVLDQYPTMIITTGTDVGTEDLDIRDVASLTELPFNLTIGALQDLLEGDEKRPNFLSRSLSGLNSTPIWKQSNFGIMPSANGDPADIGKIMVSTPFSDMFRKSLRLPTTDGLPVKGMSGSVIWMNTNTEEIVTVQLKEYTTNMKGAVVEVLDIPGGRASLNALGSPELPVVVAIREWLEEVYGHTRGVALFKAMLTAYDTPPDEVLALLSGIVCYAYTPSNFYIVVQQPNDPPNLYNGETLWLEDGNPLTETNGLVAFAIADLLQSVDTGTAADRMRSKTNDWLPILQWMTTLTEVYTPEGVTTKVYYPSTFSSGTPERVIPTVQIYLPYAGPVYGGFLPATSSDNYDANFALTAYTGQVADDDDYSVLAEYNWLGSLVQAYREGYDDVDPFASGLTAILAMTLEERERISFYFKFASMVAPDSEELFRRLDQDFRDRFISGLEGKLT
jgi:hypothetical protein